MSGISPSADLLRGFAVDFLTSHDPEAARRVMHPDYRLQISGHLLAGREDNYLPATVAQLELFPGLCVSVHDVVLGPDAVAMRFTEHGRSAREDRVSSWGGITLFRIEDGTMRHGWAEEDYYARKLQLKSGEVNVIRAPHPAPWDQPVCLPQADTEQAIRAWLAAPRGLVENVDEISAGGPPLAEVIDPAELELSILFTAGNRGAFHGTLGGEYRGGFSEVDQQHRGRHVTVPIAGIVDVSEGVVTHAQICADRLGMSRRLSHGSP